MRWSWIGFLLAGCPWAVPAAVAHVHHGPAFGEAATTLAAIPVSCRAEPAFCGPAQGAAVANATRMTLELAGYSIVDSELINAELRRRSTRAHDAHVETEVTGATWAELPAAPQRELLAAIGVAGLLRTDISIGDARGLAQRRTVTIAVTVTRLDARIVWQSDCAVDTGDFHSTEQAIELATRCALDSGTLW